MKKVFSFFFILSLFYVAPSFGISPSGLDMLQLPLQSTLVFDSNYVIPAYTAEIPLGTADGDCSDSKRCGKVICSLRIKARPFDLQIDQGTKLYLYFNDMGTWFLSKDPGSTLNELIQDDQVLISCETSSIPQPERFPLQPKPHLISSEGRQYERGAKLDIVLHILKTSLNVDLYETPPRHF